MICKFIYTGENMKQSTYWNSVAEKRNFTTIFQEKEFCKYADKSSRILDVGCGYGRTMNELYNSGYKNLIGADTAIEMINRGKREFPYLEFVKCTDVLPFDNNTFDAVILFGVLCSAVSDYAHINLINEIKRVLKPNGIIYVNDFLINTIIPYKRRYKNFEKEFGVYGIYKTNDGGILRHHTEKYILELLNCFDILEYKKIKFKTVSGNVSNGFYFIGRN